MNKNPNKVIIPCRFSFLHCWEPDSVNGSEPKYSVSAIIPKSDTTTVNRIKAAIENAKKESISKWGGRVPPNLKLPLRDGDIDRPDDEAYAGCYFLNSCFAKIWSNKEVSFSELCGRLSSTVRTPETVEEYPHMPKKDRDRAKDKGGFVGGYLKDGRRKGGAVECRSMLTLDGDKVEPGFIDFYTLEHRFASVLYTTHGHTPDAPRVRIVIPLTRDVTPDEYSALARYVVAEIGIDGFDECSYRAHQLMYWPTTPSNGEYVYKKYEGDWLDPDEYLKAHPNWRDCSQLPTSSRESRVVARATQHQQDPLEKPGIIGAFCRTYSVTAAIERFLQGIYEPSVMEGRYDYVPADSQAGVVIYDDKFAYSHHASDPACGKLLNAFDVVRIHKFGKRDEGSAENEEPTRLPSFKAMQDLAAKDEAVKKTLASERMAQAVKEFEDPDDWQKVLELDRQGRVKDTMVCGDSTNPDDVNLLMDGIKANLVVTDPPYNVAYQSADGKSIQNDSMGDQAFYEFLLAAFRNMANHMAEGGSAYIFHADTEGLNFRRAFKEAGFHISGVCIWVKNSLVLGRSPYHWQHEPVLYGWLPNGKHKWFSDRKQSTIWNFDKPKKNGDHPTMKPIPLVAYPIKNSSAPNGVVLDLFGGSGSTLIACEETDRICRTMELDPRYASVIVQRYAMYKENSNDIRVIRRGEELSYDEIVGGQV